MGYNLLAWGIACHNHRRPTKRITPSPIVKPRDGRKGDISCGMNIFSLELLNT